MDITILGIDLGKNSCSVVGFDASGRVVLRRRMQRQTIVNLAAKLSPCVIAMGLAPPTAILLPDREMSTLSTWLTDHHGVEIIARDWAGAYARGAPEGSPEPQQVANRWHLLRNCSDALQNVVERRY